MVAKLNKVFLLILILFVLSLTACTPKTLIVKEKEYVGFYIDKTFLSQVEEPAPPEKKEFLNSTPEIQRDLLGLYSLSVLSRLRSCNISINEISRLYESYVKDLNEMNKTSKVKP